ncbi:MAG: hypothetical protein IVW53_06645 [Chloroflexi bacterium]|nr:hypothetical protein [Chloroflexota bacterium]
MATPLASFSARHTRSDGRRTRRSLLGRSRAEVRDKLQTALRAEAAGLPVPSERLTVGTFLDQWLAESVRPSVRPRTYTSHAGIIRLRLAPGLGHLPSPASPRSRSRPSSTRGPLSGSRPGPSRTSEPSSVRHSARPSDGGS